MRTLKNILSLSAKELRSLFGDTVLVVLIVMMFSTMVYNTATNATSDVRNANIGIVDYDRSPLTRQIVAALLPPQFSKPVYVNPNDTQDLLDKSQLTFVLEFPPNFQRDVLAGRAPEAQLLVDATAMTQAGMGSGYITQIFSREIQEFMGVSQQIRQAMPARAVVNLQYNPNNQSSWFMGAAMAGNNIMLITLVLVGAAVIRERERGTMEHLLVMPVTATEIVAAKILANGLVVSAAAVLSMKFVVGGAIGAHLAGSLALYAVGVVLFMFSVASLSVMLATLAPTMPQYSLLMVPTYIVFMMFSGSTSPRANMPEMAQRLSEYWPSTQFAHFAQSVMFRGAGLETVWVQLLALSVSGAVFLGLALVRFRKMLEKQG
ncbi:ABC transporter permease [Kingella oralis]|uniref:ABC transporter permease n=1 Tax=Kingella oralis TaxID=505 RepID=UPI003C6FBFF2